ncbi:hypothetical protein KKF84_16635, partial [Myxococcota bacterium]|nr:hypothetical protein [Myxococcota bacterium]
MKQSLLLFSSLALLLSCAPGGEQRPDVSAHPSLSTTLSVETLIESHHPYGDYHDASWEINAPSAATSVIIPFERLETERYYDFVKIYDRDGTLVHNLSGTLNGQSYTVEGNYARIQLVSDYSIDGYGILITRYQYTVDEAHARDHRPYCGALGSRSEGWYWGDTGELIRYENCASASEPVCDALGSRSEGWYSSTGLIAWDFCHRTIRIALTGETCGPSIGFSCNEGLFCAGLPLDTLGGTGTCIEAGSCTTELDCLAQNGEPPCPGTWSCEENACTPLCPQDPVEEGIWSWSTFLVQNVVESAHPYANNFSNTWDVSWPGAAKIKVHFSRYAVETNYDYLTLSGNIQEPSVRLTGSAQDVWSPEFNGDTARINLATDYSVTDYGFAVDSISIYHQLPVGACNIDSECDAAEFCQPNRCFTPYGPCHGTCQPRQAGGIGDACDEATPCESGLLCKNTDASGQGTCRD